MCYKAQGVVPHSFLAVSISINIHKESEKQCHKAALEKVLWILF